MDVVKRARLFGSLERVLLLKEKETGRYYKAGRQHLATLSSGAHTAPVSEFLHHSPGFGYEWTGLRASALDAVSAAAGEPGAAEEKTELRASAFDTVRAAAGEAGAAEIREPVVPDSIYWMDHDTCRVGFGPLGTVETVVTNSGHRARSWISKLQRDCQLSGNYIVGLAVEWRINFGRDDETPLAYIQLSTGRHCLLFEIRRADFIPQSLRDFLADSRTTFVGVGICEHAFKLSYWDLTIGNSMDLRDLAADRMRCEPMLTAELPRLVSTVLGVDMNNSSNWVRKWLALQQVKHERLMQAQVKCACADAFLAFQAGRRLLISSTP